MTSHITRPADVTVASEIMTRSVTSLPPDMGLDDAWKKLSKLKFSGVPVVDDGTVVGILSESDVVRALASAAFSDHPVGRVRDAMHSPVATATPSTDVFAMVDMMRRDNIRRLPICEDGKLVGILTIKDLDRALLKMIEKRNAEVHSKPAGAAWDPEESRKRDKK
ncbi:MAG: CBS domain-containing protein [Alphaproteobacteria bacterium]|nr:CBS domain-containing protein [Alphaproteobacteria bacterium]